MDWQSRGSDVAKRHRLYPADCARSVVGLIRHLVAIIASPSALTYKLAGIAGSLPKSKGYGRRAQVAEATMTLFTAFVFIAVTLAVTAG